MTLSDGQSGMLTAGVFSIDMFALTGNALNCAVCSMQYSIFFCVHCQSGLFRASHGDGCAPFYCKARSNPAKWHRKIISHTRHIIKFPE
jgi:hypothetical protein